MKNFICDPFLKSTKTIVFEGADKQGKNTQVCKLVRYLIDQGYSVYTGEIPRYNSYTGRLLKRMLESGSAVKHNYLFQFIQFLNKFVFQTLELNEAIGQYDYIVLDRWALSSVIYGSASNVNESFSDIFFNILKQPTQYVVLYGSSFYREGSDSYESNSKFQEDVKQLYKDWSTTHRKECVLVDYDGCNGKEEIFELILGALELKGII